MVEIDNKALNEWKQNFEKFAIDDIRKVLSLDEELDVKEKNVSVGLILLTFIALEALSGYYIGELANKETANKFISDFFPKEYGLYFEDIYRLRNSLTHDYSVDPGQRSIVMFHYPSESHLKRCKKHNKVYLSFNRSRFAQDFLVAWGKYWIKVSKEVNIFEKWRRRVDHERGFLQLIPNPCDDNEWSEDCKS